MQKTKKQKNKKQQQQKNNKKKQQKQENVPVSATETTCVAVLEEAWIIAMATVSTGNVDKKSTVNHVVK